ncbi:enoyl-CoA hydratase/isomerase family protein [Pseudonocardia sp. Cha107L01]|uniref:enoyl-CoA hydratase/isomerase family protein n=1 Tax=Pseudonocardia sp. Cha107L01 TaxID=3457576 RepID=UPI00403ED28C
MSADPPPVGRTLVDVSREGRVARMTMRRPPQHKLDLGLTRALRTTLVELDAADDVRAIVLTGSEGVFCGGADLPEITASGTLHDFSDAIVELFALFPELRTPVVAAVNGDALAGGFGLMCCADIVLAVDDALLGTVEARFGSWPVIAQVAALQRTPFPALRRNVLTGKPFTAEQAERLGVVDETVPALDLHARALEVAEEITVAGDAVATGRRELYRACTLPFREALRAGADAFVALAER